MLLYFHAMKRYKSVRKSCLYRADFTYLSLETQTSLSALETFDSTKHCYTNTTNIFIR